MAGGLALLLAAGAARAQLPYAPRYEGKMRAIGLRGGVLWPMNAGGLSGSVDDGRDFALDGSYFLSDWIALGAELRSYGSKPRSQELAVPGLYSLRAAGEFSGTSLGLTTRVNFIRASDWSPYAALGLGLHASKFSLLAPGARYFTGEPARNCAAKGSCAAELVRSGSASGLMLVAAAGVERLGLFFENMSGFSELSLRRYFLPESKAGVGLVESLTLAFGVRFWLGLHEKARR